ncbi:MAG: hypothetical protein ACI956_001490 [Nonlabens sp.]
MDRGLLKYCLVLLITFTTGVAIAQLPVIQMQRDSLRIGEQMGIVLAVAYPANHTNLTIEWPVIEEQFSEFIEIIDSTAIDTLPVKPGDETIVMQQRAFIVTSFDSGYYAIQPFAFVINGDTLKTDAKFLYVNTVPVNMEEPMRPMKGIYIEPFDWWAFLKKWGPIFALTLGVLALMIYLLDRKSKRTKSVVKEIVIKEPAHIIAYRSLSNLEDKQLLASGKEKLYQSELTAILRTYLEDRYDIQAMEQTTGETIKNLKYSTISSRSMENMVQVLNMADVVKFAKGQLSQQINEAALSKVKGFVDETKMIEQNNIIESE